MPDRNDEDVSQPLGAQPAPATGDGEQLPESVGRRQGVRRLRIAAATTVVAVVVAAIAISVLGSSASGHETTNERQISALLAGIPQSKNALGSPTAPVTMQYFGDLECSTSRIFTLQALPSIIRNWVRSGALRIEYRSLRTVSEPQVFATQQVAALAAGTQHRLWYYVENFYHEQGPEHSRYVTEHYLHTLARQVPDLNLEQWSKERSNPHLAAQVTEDEQAAAAAHLNSTPSLLIGRTGSTAQQSFNQSSALDLAAITKVVRQILRSQPSRGSYTNL